MQCRIKRHNILSKNDMDWKKKSGEYAYCIWEWWTARVKEFPCHDLALRLVFMSQLPSCSVERVLSCHKLICDRCDEALYEDMLEIRVFLQCNGNHEELHESCLPFSMTTSSIPMS